MKHAGQESLDALGDLLLKIRACSVLTERKRGTFYKKASAFLHFHEDPEGVFADLKTGREWERYRVSTKAEQSAFLKMVFRALDPGG
ncbi:MAG TPA: hypothetical protein VI756_23550 [Blastocatellia bacterium]